METTARQNAIELMLELFRRFDEKTVSGFTAF
jgi:hypothetical protein